MYVRRCPEPVDLTTLGLIWAPSAQKVSSPMSEGAHQVSIMRHKSSAGPTRTRLDTVVSYFSRLAGSLACSLHIVTRRHIFPDRNS